MKRLKRFKRRSDLVKFAIHNTITRIANEKKTRVNGMKTSIDNFKKKDFLSWAQGILRGNDAR